MMLLLCPSFSTATHQTKDKNQYRLFPWMLLQGGTWLLGSGHHWSYSCWSSSTGTRTSQNEELFQTARKYQPPVSVYDFSFCYCYSLPELMDGEGQGKLLPAQICSCVAVSPWTCCPRFAQGMHFFLTIISWEYVGSAQEPPCWLEDLPSELQMFSLGSYVTSKDVTSGKHHLVALCPVGFSKLVSGIQTRTLECLILNKGKWTQIKKQKTYVNLICVEQVNRADYGSVCSALNWKILCEASCLVLLLGK